jgi:ribosome-associated protein
MASKKGGRPKIGSSHAGFRSGGAGARGERVARGAGGAAPLQARPAPKGLPKGALKGKKRPPPPKRSQGPQAGPKKAPPRSESWSPPQRRENRGKRSEVRSEPSEHAKRTALVTAMAALDKKAVDVQILDVVGRVDYADYLVLMSGRSDRHVIAIADGIEEELGKGRDELPPRKASYVEGRQAGNWIVLDFGDVVAHVFQEEARSHYDLDSLWQDARRVPVSS